MVYFRLYVTLPGGLVVVGLGVVGPGVVGLGVVGLGVVGLGVVGGAEMKTGKGTEQNKRKRERDGWGRGRDISCQTRQQCVDSVDLDYNSHHATLYFTSLQPPESHSDICLSAYHFTSFV